jgi:hypothetical protein
VALNGLQDRVGIEAPFITGAVFPIDRGETA